jgi:hypothetical protein
MRLILLLVTSLFASTAAFADGELQTLLRDTDKQALQSFDDVKSKALAAARTSGPAEDVKVLDAALSGTAISMSAPFDPTGNWKCRTIKLGGTPPLTVYPNFRCTITDDGIGWFLKKQTGSQRTQGHFYTESATRLIYLGVGYVTGETPGKYETANKESHVAVVERLGDKKLVLQFPKPVYESEFDILLLER